MLKYMKSLCVTLTSCFLLQTCCLCASAKEECKKDWRQLSAEEKNSKNAFDLKSAAVGAAVGTSVTAVAGVGAHFLSNYIGRSGKVSGESNKLYWSISGDPKAVFKSYIHGKKAWTPGGLQTIEWYNSHYGLDESGYYISGEDGKKYYIKIGTKFAVELPGENRENDNRTYLLATLDEIIDDISEYVGTVEFSLTKLARSSLDPRRKHSRRHIGDWSSEALYNWWDENHVYIYTKKSAYEAASFNLERKV